LHQKIVGSTVLSSFTPKRFVVTYVPYVISAILLNHYHYPNFLLDLLEYSLRTLSSRMHMCYSELFTKLSGSIIEALGF